MSEVFAKDSDQNISDKDETIRRIGKVVICWPKFTDNLKQIDESRKRSKYSSEPRCLLFTGETGDGKTTLGTYYEDQFPRVISDEGTIVPVLYSSIPGIATVKGLASRLLEDLGDPLHDRGTTHSMTSRLCKLIKECKVELIILDEFQHLINSDSNKVLSTTADWLKDVLNRTKVPIVLMGLPHCDTILLVNPQLMRRFSKTIKLTAFKWTPEEDREDFLRFLNMMENAIPMNKPSHIYEENLAFRIFWATRGIISYIKKLLSKAAQICYENGIDHITIEVLALAYDQEIVFSNMPSRNPFLCTNDELINYEVPAASANKSAVAGKIDGGNRKTVVPSASAILTRK